MSLLPAAMRLPNDITALGRKVAPKPAVAEVDPVKVFEKMAHPFPDGRQCPVQKPFFGFDIGAADMTSVFHKEMKDTYEQAFSAIMSRPAKEKTATEMMLKQREAEWSMRAQRAPDFHDLDHEVAAASRRTGIPEEVIARRIMSACGGDVKRYQIESAIAYARALFS